MVQRRSASSGGSSATIRILFAVAIVVFSLISYFASSQYNPITGEKQYLSLTPDQEIALGQQAVPELIQEFGGEYRDESIQAQVEQIGFRLVNESVARDTPWEFDFHVLDDPNTINAFALPGGQVFITTGLLFKLNEEQTAGVLAHEIMHVLARHGAQRIAQSELTNGIVGAVGVATGEASAAQTAAMIGQLVNMSYGRDDELQSDTYGVCLMIDAGYDPNAMVEVMQVLAEASGGQSQPEFFSTHPNPENRIAKIQQAIQTTDQFCPDDIDEEGVE